MKHHYHHHHHNDDGIHTLANVEKMSRFFSFFNFQFFKKKAVFEWSICNWSNDDDDDSGGGSSTYTLSIHGIENQILP